MQEEKTFKDLYKEDTHKGLTMSATINYAIMTMGKKYHNPSETSAFQAHMLREMAVPNADASKTYLNQNLKGVNDVVETLRHFLSDCKPWKKNQVCARELLLTASKRFFDGISQETLNHWIEENVKFLEKEFGDNFLFGVTHLDEQVPHIHVLVACKFYDHNKQEWRVQHYKYFDGRERLREWQDKYAEHMQKNFPLQRGAMYNKSQHNDIKRLYGILDKDNLDMSEQEAKTKLQLQDIRLKRLEGTVENIRMINNKLIIENSELLEENKSLKDESIFMQKAVKDLMARKFISQKDWELSKASVQVNQNQSKRIGS